jgi:hypothetical protein
MNMTDEGFAAKVAVNVVSEIFTKALSDWNKWRKKAEPYDFFGIAGRQYATRMAERYDSMKILGMAAPVPLRDIYVRVNILERITARHGATVQELEEFFKKDKTGFG